MAEFNPTYILIGANSKIQIAPYGTTQGASTSVGYTQGPVVLSVEETWEDVIPDQTVGPVTGEKQEEIATLNIPMLEQSFKNIGNAYGVGEGNTAADSIEYGGATSGQFFSVWVAAPGTGSKTRTVEVYKVRPGDGAREIGIAKDGAVVMNAPYRAYLDTTKSAGKQYFKISEA